MMEDRYKLALDLGFKWHPGRSYMSMWNCTLITISDKEIESQPSIEALKDLIHARFANVAHAMINELPLLRIKIQNGENLYYKFTENPELLKENKE